jgi:hypothetical protein
LIILGIFNQDSVAEMVRTVVTKVTNAIMNAPNIFERFLVVQPDKDKRVLHRFVETRWLSDFVSFQRFKLLKSSILFVLEEANHDLLQLISGEFWLRLDLMIELLDPLQLLPISSSPIILPLLMSTISFRFCIVTVWP